MQKIKIIKNPIFSGETFETTLATGESLLLSNNYYSYTTQIGGELVNDNNVRNYLDKPENSQLAENFVIYLQENTNLIEFKEIFYDNKKLAYTFNEYYKNNYVQNFNEHVSIEKSLEKTTEHTTINTFFNADGTRTNDKINLLNPISSGDSYFISVKIYNQKKTINSTDYSKYFKDCIRESYIDKSYLFINSVETNYIYANIPYIIKNRNKNFNFGYTPIQNINFNDLKTPIMAGQGKTGFELNFLDFNQFIQHFSFEPPQLLNDRSGIFISQSRILINNTGTFSVSPNSPYNTGNLNYSAQFEINPILEFDKHILTSITIPFTVSLSQASVGNTYLNVCVEKYSTALLGYSFFTNPQLLPYDQKSISFSHGSDKTTDSITIVDKISPEDTIVLSLRNLNNTILGYLIIRCEEFFGISNYIDNSYLLVENVIKNKMFLNCFVDYNYNMDDMEFYRNDNVVIVENKPSQNNKQITSSLFDIKRLINLSKLNETKIKNIYFMGSKIYGTNNFNSDMDFTIIADTGIEEQVFADELYQVKILSISKYNNDLANSEFPTIEFRFLPEYAKIKESLSSYPPINYNRLYNSAENKITLNMNLIKSYFKNKGNDYIINKLVFHCFRILIFSLEIVKTGSLSDFTIANDYYNFASKYNFNSFNDLEKIVNPKLNELKNQLKIAISDSTN